MQYCDVLIVGGGPAGSSLAWGLRDSGLNVIVMDKQTFPRNKTCAGWITPAVIKTLQLDIEQYARENIFQPVRGFRIGLIGSDTVDINYNDKPASYGIRRCEFDHYLLKRCGATLRQGEAFTDMQRKNNTWIVNGNIQTPLVVGAGGHFCPVARYLGAKVGRTETAVTAQEAEFRLDVRQMAGCDVDPEIPELYFCPDLKGYGWILRKGDYLNIGLGREGQHKLSGYVEEFCNYLRNRNRINFTITDKFNGHAYLLYQHSMRPEHADGILLIGDAAGLAYTQSGEGIRPAIESGLLASRIILNANGKYESSNLMAYDEAITARFGKRKYHKPLLPAFSERCKQIAGRNLLKSRWFARNVIIDRWFLHSSLPPLA